MEPKQNMDSAIRTEVSLLEESGLLTAEEIEQNYHPSNKSIMSRYSLKYPQHLIPTKNTLHSTFFRQVDLYNAVDLPEESPYRQQFVSLMRLNYFHHLLKTRTELDEVVILLHKDHVPQMTKPARCHPNDHTRNYHFQNFPELDEPKAPPFAVFRVQGINNMEKVEERKRLNWSLLSGTSELQGILRPEFGVPVATTPEEYPADEPWKDKWHPVHLSMPFHLFGATAGCSKNYPLLRKWYTEYMGKVAESDHEFLLAVISVYGLNFKYYPERVLALLQQRDMFLPKYQLGQGVEHGSGQSGPVRRDNHSEVTNRIASWWPSTFSKLTPSDTKKTQNEENTDGTKSVEIKIEKEDTDKGTRFQKQPNPKFNLTFSSFAIGAREACKYFFNDDRMGNPEERDLVAWYEPTTEELKLNTHRLNATFVQILNDIWNFHHIDKFNAPASMSAEEIEVIQGLVNPLLQKRLEEAKSSGIKLANISGIMESQTSPLQLLLRDATAIENDAEFPGIPEPSDWNPINCNFPYFAFEILVNCQPKAICCQESSPLITCLIKLRYVEFLARTFASDHFQFLLAIFSAYGPNFYDYPVKVIQLLQDKGLLLTEFGIPTFDLKRGKLFEPLVGKPGRKHAANGAIQAVIPVDKNEEDHTVLNARINLPSGSKKQAATGMKLRSWIKASKKGLGILHLPLLSQMGFQETYNRMEPIISNPAVTSGNEFIKGILTGISITLKSQEEQRHKQSTTDVDDAASKNSGMRKRGKKRNQDQVTSETELSESLSANTGGAKEHFVEEKKLKIDPSLPLQVLREPEDDLIPSESQPIIFDYRHGL